VVRIDESEKVWAVKLVSWGLFNNILFACTNFPRSPLVERICHIVPVRQGMHTDVIQQLKLG
jgi:hypothetical protein